MEAEKKQRRWLLPVIIVLLVIVVALLVVLLTRQNSQSPEEPVNIADLNVPRIGYAEGVTMVEDPDALRKAIEDMYASSSLGSNIALEYKNDAMGQNGKDFDCYIGNSLLNQYDMYIGIYADGDFSDELYLSSLIRPGYAFDKLTLNRALDPGDHRLYVVFTQVEEVDGVQSIHGQVSVTMDFHVNP